MKYVFSLLLFWIASPVFSADIYVSIDGSDENSGKVESPLKSLDAARNAVRQFAGKQAVTVHVADGVYYLSDTLIFSPADSGTKELPIVYKAENDGQAIISGGIKLDLTWEGHGDGIVRAKTPPNIDIDQLFINGVGQRMARYPNYDATKITAAYQGYAADAFSKERASGWKSPSGGFIHAMHRNRWGGYHYRITGKKANGEVEFEGGWQNNRRMGMHRDFRMVENIFEELDAPGEWYHDAKNHWLYYKPEAHVDLAKASVEVVRLRHLVKLQGTEGLPVKHLTFRGFVVRHAARTFMDTREPLLRSDWAIYRGGSFLLAGTEDVCIFDIEFDQVGGNAVFASNYNRRVHVSGCHIHDVGGSGICFVGDPNSVRDPLFEYGQTNDLEKLDRTPGPQSNNYPANCVVEDCLIHGIGRVERQPAGIQISMSSNITVRDCSIYDCARAGINIGDGCWGGHLIEGCDVFDTVLETHDHGSFNSWGRDRYWHRDRGKSQIAVDADPELPLLDAIETTVIRNSRWRCDHGWDIDLDDGSTNYHIYNNLMLQGGLKLREGFRRRAWNNITINNGFHPHVWYNHSQDEVYSNIFMAAHRGARMPGHNAKGKRVDSNLFYVHDQSIKDRYTEFGWDVKSVVANPNFVDPKSGDFRVNKGSAAFAIGFENFPMDQFGVKKPSLKLKAKTPVIPELKLLADRNQVSQARKSSPPEVIWLGAVLKDLSAEEYSAYGTRKEDGGVVLASVPKTSEAGVQGFQDGDLVQAVNHRSVQNSAQLLSALTEIGGRPLSISLVRNQKRLSLALLQIPFIEVKSNAPNDDLGKGSLNTAQPKKIVTNTITVNEPLSCLHDNKLAKNYGPVFRNGESGGAYKMDLGNPKYISAIRSSSYNMNQNRGGQKMTIYASDSQNDPGWNMENRQLYTALGSIDTSSLKNGAFTTAALLAPPGKNLGKFRWVVWRVSPVTALGENTAFQELCVEVKN